MKTKVIAKRLSRSKWEGKAVLVNLPVEMVKDIDRRAKANNITRTRLITGILGYALKNWD